MEVALFRNQSFVSRAIKFVTRSPYSHAAIILDDGTVIEAKEFHGVRQVNSLTELLNKKSIVDIFDFDATEDQKQIITNFLLKQVGKKYDYWMVFGFIWHATRESRKSSGRWFCSELVFAALEKAGILLLNNVEPWMVAPSLISYSNILKPRFTFQLA